MGRTRWRKKVMLKGTCWLCDFTLNTCCVLLLQEAIETFKEALKLKADFIDAYKSLGQAYRYSVCLLSASHFTFYLFVGLFYPLDKQPLRFMKAKSYLSIWCLTKSMSAVALCVAFFPSQGAWRLWISNGKLPESPHAGSEPYPVPPAPRHDAVPPRLAAGGHRQLQGIHTSARWQLNQLWHSNQLMPSHVSPSRGVFSWSPTTRCASTWRGWATWRWGSSTRASRLKLKSC